MTSTLYLLTAGMSSFELEEIRVTKRTGVVSSRLGAVVYGRICCMVYYSQRMPAFGCAGNAVCGFGDHPSVTDGGLRPH